MSTKNSAVLDLFRLSDADLAAFISCPVKLALLSNGAEPSDPEFVEGAARLKTVLRPRQISHLEKYWPIVHYDPDLHSPESIALLATHQVILDLPIHLNGITKVLDAVQVSASKNGKYLSPVQFSSDSTAKDIVRILLCFDAMVLEAAFGRRPSEGLVVLACEPYTTRVKFTEHLLKGTNDYIHAIVRSQPGYQSNPGLSVSETAPVRLNPHCSGCQYQYRCLTEAKATDDLSLLSGMSGKEQDQMRNRGIFTVNQYSYTFKLTRSKNALQRMSERRSHALTALAIREQRTYLLGLPEFSIQEGDVFVDVEGNPTLGSYYLIGVLKSEPWQPQYQSFWADCEKGEGEIFRHFASHLISINCKRIIHYGSFESEFIRKMLARHQLPDDIRRDFESIECHNLLKTIYEHIYFPCRSNSLKEIGALVDASWRHPKASGARANLWRCEWELSNEEVLKNRLIEYNEDDCRALSKVAARIANVCAQSDPTVQSFSVENTLLPPYSRGYATEDLKLIGLAARWERQRDMVYIGKAKRKLAKTPSKKLAALPTKTLVSDPYLFCPTCGNRRYKVQKLTKVSVDLEFKGSSISAYRYNHIGWRVKCRTCNSIEACKREPWPVGKFGVRLLGFFVYQLLEHVGLGRSVARMIHTLFGVEVNSIRLRVYAANRFRNVYSTILSELKTSHVIHADETSVRLKKGAGYVWVLSNAESVYFFYTATRESAEVKELLSGYRGVLVTDFYSGYDSIDCSQQKCLIHLMRDFNDDLLSNPFHAELRTLTEQFSSTMRTVISAIENGGSKKSSLAALIPLADNLVTAFCDLQVTSSESPLMRFKQRFIHYKDRLFEFLRHDDVSWNNNLAEHAIKEFSRVRKQVDGLLTPQSLNDYLVLLSICATCKYRKVPLLPYLTSESIEMKAFQH